MRLNAISIVTRPSASAMPPGMSKGSRAARGCDAGRPRNSSSAAIAIGMRNQNTAGQSQTRHQRAAEQGTEHQAERHHHGIDAERPAAPFLAVEACHQCGAAAQHQCGADALHAAKNQHRAVARRIADKQEGHRAPDQPGPVDDGVADGVADPPQRQQQAGIGQHVADHHPLDVADREIKSPGDGGEGDVDGGVELRRGRAQPDHRDLPGLRISWNGGCRVTRREDRPTTGPINSGTKDRPDRASAAARATPVRRSGSAYPRAASSC